MQAEGAGSREPRARAADRDHTGNRQGADRGPDREQTNLPVEVAAHIDADNSSPSS